MKRIILSLLCCSALIDEEKLNLIADPHFSPYAGGEDLIGRKSKGFVAGESLEAALTARGGISLSW